MTLAILRGIQGIAGAALPPAGVSHLFFNFRFSYLINSVIQIGILAHAFPPSRARSLAFATFSSGGALGAATGNIMGGALTEFTQYEFSCALRFFILPPTYSIQKNMAFLFLPINRNHLHHSS
jgi:hypothetical protein